MIIKWKICAESWNTKKDIDIHLLISVTLTIKLYCIHLENLKKHFDAIHRDIVVVHPVNDTEFDTRLGTF